MSDTLYIHAVKTDDSNFSQFKSEVQAVTKIIDTDEVDVSFSYDIRPNILKEARLESDSDLDKRWLATEFPDTEAHVYFLHLTQEEWRKLGIRDTLWGQSRVVNGKVICYGRWYEGSTYEVSQYFPTGLKDLKEMTIGLAHEISHGLSNLFGIKDKTHYHFYGLDSIRSSQRYNRTPTPRLAFKFLPWHELPEINKSDNYTLLQTIVKLLKKVVSLYKEKNEAIDILARTMWGEARGCGRESMYRVGCVVRNRLRSKHWPDSYKEVCMQSSQFSAWNQNDPNRIKVESVTKENEVFKLALIEAKRVIEGGNDDTHGADHYHALSLSKKPLWADEDKIVKKDNCHVFYRLY